MSSLIELYISRPLQDEVERVLAAKFSWSSTRVAAATGYLWGLTRSIQPHLRLDDCPDLDDNRVLECAVAAGATWIVTGDQHLLQLDPYRSIAIVTPRRFLDEAAWNRGQ